MATDKSQVNVILIVADTLRKDYSSGLDALTKIGFVPMENVFATSSWTLPSHASIFTGLLPSSHGIHEGREVNIRNIHKLKSALANVNQAGLLKMARESKYSTYCLTANPLISPQYGFTFDFYKSYDARGDSTLSSNYLWNDKSRFGKALSILKNGKFGLLARLFYDDQVKRNASRLLRRPPLEKGSKYLARDLQKLQLKKPFLLFINLMEAHPPYLWTERSSKSIQFDSITGKYLRRESVWRERYSIHSEFATSRLVDIVQLLESYEKDSLFIVTSDHGQLLGENGHYDHGYFLDEALLKVPLYVRFPEEYNFEIDRGQFMNLIEIPKLIESVILGKPTKLGDDYAISESFGPVWDLSDLPKGQHELSLIKEAESHRVVIFCSTGRGIYNVERRTFEECEGDIPSSIINSLGQNVLKHDDGTYLDSMNQEEERLVTERLKQLGYV